MIFVQKITPLVAVLTIVLLYSSCHGEPSKNQDGTITFDLLPSLGSFVVYPDQYRDDDNRLATLADLSRGFVNMLQPNGFPNEYAIHLTEVLSDDKELNVMDELFLGMKNFLGIIICFLLGILVFVFLPWIALIFFSCRCCGNCGGKREQLRSNLCCKQIGLSFCLLACLGVLCAGAVYIDFANNFMSRAKDVSFQTSIDGLDDLQTFTSGSQKQLEYILEEEYGYVEDITNADLSNVGVLVAEPVESYLLKDVQVQGLFTQFENLIQDVNNTRIALEDTNSLRSALIFAAAFVYDTLQTYSDRLDTINTTCAGCVPSNNGLTVNFNFTQLPILNEQINGSNTALNDIISLYNLGKEVLEQMSIDIDTAAEDPINDIDSVIDSAGESIAEVYQDAEDQLLTVLSNLEDYEEFMKERISITDDYDMYREYGMLALSLLGFLIFGIFFTALIMGSLFAKNVDPRYRSSASNFCGNFLMFGVVLTFLLTPLLMLLTSGFFLSLAPVTLTCKPLKNLQLINETVDQPDLISDGYWLGDVILGNSSIPLTFTSILEDCGRNSSIYNTLQLQHTISVDDLQKIIPELRNQTSKLLDEINIDDLDLTNLVPDNLRELLQHAVDNMLLDDIDFTSFETLLQEDLVTDDLVQYAIALETAADDNPDVSDDLNRLAFDLRQFQQSTVWVIEGNMAEMLSMVHHIQSLIPQLDIDVNDTAKAGDVVEIGLADTEALEAVLDSSVANYANVIIGYFDQYIDVASRQMEDELGRCYPIRAVYDAVINVVCHYDFDSLNTVWFSFGWCTVWMIISLIFATKLAKYMRIMNMVVKPQRRFHYNDDMFGPEGNYINRTHARTDTIRPPQNSAHTDTVGPPQNGGRTDTVGPPQNSARTDTVGQQQNGAPSNTIPQQNGVSNYDNQAYYGSMNESHQQEIQMATVFQSMQQGEHTHGHVCSSSHHNDIPDGAPPSYEEAIYGPQHHQQQSNYGQARWL